MFAVPHSSTKPSFWGTARHIYGIAGLRGFFAGLSPCLLRAFPANACAFYVYEGLMRLFKAEKVRCIINYIYIQKSLTTISPDSALEIHAIYSRLYLYSTVLL